MSSKNAATATTRLNVEDLESREVPAWFGATNGLSVAVGRVFPDFPQNDIIEGTGPGRPAVIGITLPAAQGHQVLATIRPFGPFYTGGVFVATGDVTGDGQEDLIVGTAGGTNAIVKVFEFKNGGMQQIARFTPFGPNYTGGADVAAGKVTGDPTDPTKQIIVAQSNGGDTVRVFAYDNSTGTPQYDLFSSFQAYGPGYTGGVTVTSANIDTIADPVTGPFVHDYDEIITGRATQLPQVKVWNAQQPTVTVMANYMAFDITNPNNQRGINVVAGDTEGSRGAQIYVALRGTATIRIFSGQTGAVLGTFQPFPPIYSRMINFAIGGVTSSNPPDDSFKGNFFTHDLVVVAADRNANQFAIAWPGKPGSAGGLNGSQVA